MLVFSSTYTSRSHPFPKRWHSVLLFVFHSRNLQNKRTEQTKKKIHHISTYYRWFHGCQKSFNSSLLTYFPLQRSIRMWTCKRLFQTISHFSILSSFYIVYQTFYHFRFKFICGEFCEQSLNAHTFFLFSCFLAVVYDWTYTIVTKQFQREKWFLWTFHQKKL